MSCKDCKSNTVETEIETAQEAAKSARIMGDMVQSYKQQNKHLLAIVATLALTFVVMTGCMVWAVQHTQEVANKAVINALKTVSEIEAVGDTTTTATTTQTSDGDNVTFNNVDGEQYNDNATKGGAE